MEKYFEKCKLVEEILNRNQKVVLEVHGTSMYPFLFSGDQVCLTTLEDRPKIGEIYFVKLHGKYLLHRCAMERDFLVTKGDNLSSFDGVPEKWIGHVVKKNIQCYLYLKESFTS